MEPEQISGWLKKQKLNAVSHEAIYQFIREDKAYGGQLYKHLRQGRKKRRKKYGTGKSSRGQIKNRISIDERPTQIDEKQIPRTLGKRYDCQQSRQEIIDYTCGAHQ